MVVAVSRPVRVWADLGRGEDVFRGGSGRDTIAVTDNPYRDPVPEQRDRISTGGGADDVTIGEYVQVTNDVVDLGAGDDKVTVLGLLAGGVRPRGGAGSDRLSIDPDLCIGDPSNPRLCGQPPGDWVFDNALELATVDGVAQSRWSSFEEFDLTGLNGSSSVAFTGTDDDETVTTGGNLIAATMGPGDDSLNLWSVPDRQQEKASGGPGRDTISVSGRQLTIDMAAGAIWEQLTGSADDPDARFEEFEDASGAGDDFVTLVGDDADNALHGSGCSVTVKGGAGDDELTADLDGRMEDCDYYQPGVSFDGGPGADVLNGGWGPDHLDGGEGYDVADGSRGTDICLAEVRHSCEQ